MMGLVGCLLCSWISRLMVSCGRKIVRTELAVLGWVTFTSPLIRPADLFILAVNSLLHSIGQIFRDNAQTIDSTRGQHIDRKLRRRIQEKKIAMGHKPDDHLDEGMVMY